MKRGLLAVAVIVLVFVAAGALSAGRACAHDPRFACSPRDATHPVVIADPRKSWAFYGHLGTNAQDRYLIETPRAVTVPIQVLVDQRDANNPLRPIAAVSDASGRIIAVADLRGSRSFFEPFSRVTYLAGTAREVLFPAGASTITVRMIGGGTPQRYTLAVGADERFSVWEVPYLLGAVYRIHTRRF